MERLPHWVLTNKFPALFDSESATVIEQTARVYGAMQSLIDDYNLFVDKVNEHIQAFEDAATKNYDLFTKGIRQEFQDFIDTVTLKIQSQDRVIAEAVEYMTDNLATSIYAALAKYEAEGSMDAAVKRTFNQILNEMNALSSRMDTFTALEEGSTTGDAELLDIRVGADGTVYASAGAAVRGQFLLLSNSLSELESNLEPLKTTEFIEVGERLNGITNTNGVLYESGEGRSIQISVVAGEKYIITGTHINYMYPCAFVTGADILPTKLVGGNTDGEDFVNVEITIPEGATTLFVNGYDGTNHPLVSVKKEEDVYKNATTAPLYIAINDNIMFVTSKYGNEDMTVKFGKRGCNLLPDFISFYTSENSYNTPIFNEENLNVLLSPDTDWHSPFVVQAVNNANGDMPEGYAGHFTGGNHGYNNTGAGSTATARCETLDYYVDGKKVEQYTGYARNVRVFWRNFVQGNNTKKEDGTGREILIEEHTITFDGFEWKTEVELIPLENIVIKKWYGLQLCGLKSGNFSNIRYINAVNRLEYDINASSVSGNNDCIGMIVSGNSHIMRCEIDPTFDLGKRDFYAGNQGAFSLSYGKSYFFIIEDSAFNENTHYYFRGTYTFSHK